MRRINYLSRDGLSPLEAVRAGFAQIDSSSRSRSAFLLMACVAVLCSLATLWENAAVRIDELRYEKIRVQLAVLDRQLVGLRDVTTVTERLGQTARVVADVRGRASTRLHLIAELGDRIVPHAWLLSMHEEHGSIHLHGRARQAADVGAALQQLRGLPQLGEPVLNSVHQLNTGSIQAVEFDMTVAEHLP